MNWNITSEKGEIKCRVDTTNKLNVLFLSSLFVDSKTIEQCAEKFYSNDNKIVIPNLINIDKDKQKGKLKGKAKNIYFAIYFFCLSLGLTARHIPSAPMTHPLIGSA